jgi:hypothetical protein
MELIAFVVLLVFLAEAALRCGADSRPGERDHAHNW